MPADDLPVYFRCSTFELLTMVAGARIRTGDLQIMSLMRFLTSPPRVVAAKRVELLTFSVWSCCSNPVELCCEMGPCCRYTNGILHPQQNWTATNPLVAGVGFEPTTSTLWGSRAAWLLYPAMIFYKLLVKSENNKLFWKIMFTVLHIFFNKLPMKFTLDFIGRVPHFYATYR